MTYAGGPLQLGQGGREAVLDPAHPAVGAVQLVPEVRNVAHLRHFLQNRAEALQSGPDLSRVVQNALKGQRNRRVIAAPGWTLRTNRRPLAAGGGRTGPGVPVGHGPAGPGPGCSDTWRWCRCRAPPARTGRPPSRPQRCRSSPGAAAATAASEQEEPQIQIHRNIETNMGCG